MNYLLVSTPFVRCTLFVIWCVCGLFQRHVIAQGTVVDDATQGWNVLHWFEYWMGTYPFYEDSYKLVEAPYAGMEHQSTIAYGNGFANGFRGKDLSKTDWGMIWDFILVHESGR